MDMKREANATWKGSLRDGRGEITSQSGALKNNSFSFGSFFNPFGVGTAPGTNPEELLAAAHACSFSMALAHELRVSIPDTIQFNTKASVRIHRFDDRWSIEESDLFLRANLGGAPSLPFLMAATRAKANCPVSRLFLTNVTLHTEIEAEHPGAEMDSEVLIYTSTYCQICGKAKELLETQGIRYREIDLDVEPPEIALRLTQRTGLMSVPQVFVGEHFVGTYDDLVHLNADHGLKLLLQSGRDTTKEMLHEKSENSFSRRA